MSTGDHQTVLPTAALPIVGLAYLVLQIAPGAADAVDAASRGSPIAPVVWQMVRDGANVGIVGALAAFLWHVRVPVRDLLVALSSLVLQLRDTLPRIQELASKHDSELTVVRATTDKIHARLEEWGRSRHDHDSED
jgi:hypothetical protein